MLQEGGTLIYEPRALVRHRHRREIKALRGQIGTHGTALVAYYLRTATAHPWVMLGLMRLAFGWYFPRLLWRWIASYLRPSRFPRTLLIAELIGAFIGPIRYIKARRRARRIAEKFDDQANAAVVSNASADRFEPDERVAVRTIELTNPPHEVADVMGFRAVQIYLKWKDRPIAQVRIRNGYRPVSLTQILLWALRKLRSGFWILKNGWIRRRDGRTQCHRCGNVCWKAFERTNSRLCRHICRSLWQSQS